MVQKMGNQKIKGLAGEVMINQDMLALLLDPLGIIRKKGKCGFHRGWTITQGIDNNRLSMLIAVIEKYFEIPLTFQDIYVNVVGGIKLQTRESDLSIIASILSSFQRPKKTWIRPCKDARRGSGWARWAFVVATVPTFPSRIAVRITVFGV